MQKAKTHATTVLVVRAGNRVVMGSDGQVTLGQTVVKATARKLRRIGDGKVIAGFAGSAADGLTLLEKLEAKLKDANGNLMRAAVELAKDWRTDRILRRLEALLLVADREHILTLSGTGDIIEADADAAAAAVGSGETSPWRRPGLCSPIVGCRRAKSWSAAWPSPPRSVSIPIPTSASRRSDRWPNRVEQRVNGPRR